MDGRCERLRVASVNPTRRAAANSIRLLTAFSTSVPLPGKHAKFSPKWDDLRGDARFEKIVAAVAAPFKIE